MTVCTGRPQFCNNMNVNVYIECQFLNEILGLFSILIISCKYQGDVGFVGNHGRRDVPGRGRRYDVTSQPLLILQVIKLSHAVFAFWCVTMTTVITPVLCECTFLLENNLVDCMLKNCREKFNLMNYNDGRGPQMLVMLSAVIWSVAQPRPRLEAQVSSVVCLFSAFSPPQLKL